MQNFSLHTHTLGFDGQNTEAEMLAQAQNLGWKQLGFSNHFIVHPNIKESPMYKYSIIGGYQNIYSSSFDEVIAKFEKHYQTVDILQKETNIPIFKGMEVDFFADNHWLENFSKAVAHLKPDYLIGSTHFIEHNGILYNSHDLKSASKIEQNQLLHRYWQNQRAAAQSGLFTIMAHLDLMKKVGLGQEEQWQEEEQKNINIIKKQGLLVELNSSSFKRMDEPYPSVRIMKMLAQQNIPVILSDDAHASAQLGQYYSQTEILAEKCGLTIQPFPLQKNKPQNTLFLTKSQEMI